MPIIPPAPTLLSTTTGTFQRWEIRWPNRRANWSPVVPGVEGTMNWIWRDG